MSGTHDRSFQIFDLKGSTRNRHVQVSKDPKKDPNPYEVLMDENLIESEFVLWDQGENLLIP